jgi:hypothetical protein
MIDQPRLNEEVLIDEAEGHVLPPALDGASLPVRGMVVGPAGSGEELFVVSVPSMHEAKLQLHRDQLFPAAPRPARILAVSAETVPEPEGHEHVVAVRVLGGAELTRSAVINAMSAGQVFYMGSDPERQHVELKDCLVCGLQDQLFVPAPADQAPPSGPEANGPRELSLTLQALADAADNKLGEIDWPVAIINAVWAAKERPGVEQAHALDRVETMLGEVLGVERGERLSPEQMIDRLKAMRTQIDGGASITFGPPGMLVLRRLIDNEATAEEYDEISKAINAGIAVNAEFEAQRAPTPGAAVAMPVDESELCPECAGLKGDPQTVIEEGEDEEIGDLCTHPFHDAEEGS